MIDQLIKLVRTHGTETIDQNPAIPEKSRNEAATLIAQEIFAGLQHQARIGNFHAIIDMLDTSNDLNNNLLVKQMISNIAAKFAAKFAMPMTVAQSLTKVIVPKTIEHFLVKTTDPDDKDFDLQDVLKNFTGNNNVSDLLGKFTTGR
jgi:hypothetical protein